MSQSTLREATHALGERSYQLCNPKSLSLLQNFLDVVFGMIWLLCHLSCPKAAVQISDCACRCVPSTCCQRWASSANVATGFFRAVEEILAEHSWRSWNPFYLQVCRSKTIFYQQFCWQQLTCIQMQRKNVCTLFFKVESQLILCSLSEGFQWDHS